MGAIQLAPGVYIGGYDSLLSLSIPPPPYKIIVNCGLTGHFLSFLELRHTVSISSDVLIFLLDPRYSEADAKHDQLGLFAQFLEVHGRRLQNYVYHYYKNNPNASGLVESLPWLIDEMSPVFNGPLVQAYFQFNRLVKLLRHVDQRQVQFLIVGDNPQLCYGLAVLYFMDNYLFNTENCLRIISQAVGHEVGFNGGHYDDLIIADSLGKFYVENQRSKMSGMSCKRPVEDDETSRKRPMNGVYN